MKKSSSEVEVISLSVPMKDMMVEGVDMNAKRIETSQGRSFISQR